MDQSLDTICSSEEAKLREIDHLKKVLSVSGYTKSACVTATKPKAPTVPQDPGTTRYRDRITLPYVGHLTGAICRTIRKTGVSVHLKPYNTIRSRLVHPKDKVPEDERAGAVYQIQCSDCDAAYVGETERSLRKRVSEHHRSSSPVGHHLNQRRHSFSEREVSILHQEMDWFRRGVAEPIHITRESPTLNRDRGRHTLPAIYREIIQSRDPIPTSGSRDDATLQ